MFGRLHHFSDLLSEDNDSLSWTFYVSPIHTCYMGHLIYFLSHWIKEKTFPNFLKIVKWNMSRIYTAKRSCSVFIHTKYPHRFSIMVWDTFVLRDFWHFCYLYCSSSISVPSLVGRESKLPRKHIIWDLQSVYAPMFNFSKFPLILFVDTYF